MARGWVEEKKLKVNEKMKCDGAHSTHGVEWKCWCSHLGFESPQ
jgi:hypothetical protein